MFFARVIKHALLFPCMNPLPSETIPFKRLSTKMENEKEAMRKSLFSVSNTNKKKSKNGLDEAQEKARKLAQDEYMDRLEKQAVFR